MSQQIVVCEQAGAAKREEEGGLGSFIPSKKRLYPVSDAILSKLV